MTSFVVEVLGLCKRGLWKNYVLDVLFLANGAYGTSMLSRPPPLQTELKGKVMFWRYVPLRTELMNKNESS